MGTCPEYIYFDIASMLHSFFTKKLNLIIKKKGNTAKIKNEDEPLQLYSEKMLRL